MLKKEEIKTTTRTRKLKRMIDDAFCVEDLSKRDREKITFLQRPIFSYFCPLKLNNNNNNNNNIQ